MGIARRKARKTFVPITSKNTVSVKRECVWQISIQKKFFLSCLCVFYFLATPLSPQMFRLCAFQSGTFTRTVSSHTCIPAFEPSSIGCHVLCIYLRILLLSFIYRLSRARIPAYLLLKFHLSDVTCSASIYVYLLLSFIYRLSRALLLFTYCKACKLSCLCMPIATSVLTA